MVHCSRDELDTGLSIFGRNFHATHDYATDLASIGVFQREQRRLAAHWRAHLPLPLFELRYEELVESPEPTLRRLLDFCDLPWNPAVLRFHESERLVHTASRAQVQQPLYRPRWDARGATGATSSRCGGSSTRPSGAPRGVQTVKRSARVFTNSRIRSSTGGSIPSKSSPAPTGSSAERRSSRALR